MISWRHSFRRLNEEYEISKKKKQALDNLLGAGKISRQTCDLFNEEISQAIVEIEKQQKALLEKMNLKVNELEGQIKTLEMLLANFEIQHVTGEVDEETYQREIGVLSVGLETARNELNMIKEAINHISSGIEVPEAATIQNISEPAPAPTQPQPQETTVEAVVVETKAEETQQQATQNAEEQQVQQ
ncbi:MAG: CdvA-like protein [Candidatus Bathyarchaeales archaeon]